VGAAAIPASAQTYQDTALSASQVQADTFGGAGLGASNGNGVIRLAGSGVTWSLHGTVPSGVSLSGATISYSGAAVSGSGTIVADATDSAGNAEALEIPAALGNGTIQLAGTVGRVALSDLADTNTSGTVRFSASSSKSGGSRRRLVV
jgi:hypothetical protein